MIDQPIMTGRGAERVVNGTIVGKLASELRGDLIAIDNPDYDTVRKVWNGMVDKRPCRTSAQSSNFFDSLISLRVTGGSMRHKNSRSTTADLGLRGSATGWERTVAMPTTAETPPEW